MFEWINKQGVRSTNGFVVQSTGRWSMEYREGDHILEFPVSDEDFDSERGKIIMKVRIDPFPTWQPPGEFITEERRREIIENIRDALVFEDLIPEFD
jgi:hypothetical protein